MFMILILQQIELLIKLWAVLNNSKDFDYVMNIILISVYTISTIVFVPLFSAILFKLSKDYADLYRDIRLRLIFLFTFFVLFLVTRLGLYADMGYFHEFD